VGTLSRKITPSDVTAWHDTSVAFLTGAIDECKMANIPCIVVTHHLPTYRLIAPKYRGLDLNFSFATSLDELVSSYPVVAAVCGHSHANQTVSLGARKTPAILNAAGYPSECSFARALEPSRCLLSITLLNAVPQTLS
jgi:hypothetical protein